MNSRRKRPRISGVGFGAKEFEQLTNMAKRGGYEMIISLDMRSFEFVKMGWN
jgi:hypothetical protein